MPQWNRSRQPSGRIPRAVSRSHMGNPFELDGVLDLVKRHNLWLIEDNCDAWAAGTEED